MATTVAPRDDDAIATATVVEARNDNDKDQQQHHQNVDLISCEASTLANYLLTNRFNNNSLETAQFLLCSLSQLPNAEEISEQLMGGGDDGDNNEEDNSNSNEEGQKIKQQTTEEDDSIQQIGNALLPTGEENTADDSGGIEISIQQPRGKFKMKLHENGILFQNAKNEKFIIKGGTAAKDVGNMVIFPKPEDCRRMNSKKDVPTDMVLLCLKDDKNISKKVTFKNKVLKQICFQLPKISPPAVDDNTTGKDWIELIKTSLGLNDDGNEKLVARIYNPCNMPPSSSTSGTSSSSIPPKSYQFRSYDEGNTSSTTSSMPYVKCYHGVNDGVLYPMVEGLLFHKPTMFIPRSALNSISCGRGSGGSRYVDMIISVDNDNTEKEDEEQQIEFTNIHRDELHVLNNYIHKVLIPIMKQDAMADDGSEADEEEMDDMHADDNDAMITTAVTASASEEEGGSEESAAAADTNNNGRRVSKRKASQVARNLTRKEILKKKKTKKGPVEEEEDENDSVEEDEDFDDDDDEEENWDSEVDDDDDVSHGDMSFTGVNECPISDDDGEDDEDDDFNVEVADLEEEDTDATESDDE